MSLWRPGVVLPTEKLSPQLIEDIKAALSPEQTVALTAWAEARSRLELHFGWVSNPIEAMADIVNVVYNRSLAKGVSVKEICLARAQFSCWAPLQGTGNFDAIMQRAQQLLAAQPQTDKLLGCLALAHGVQIDALDGATHYYAPASMVPAGRVPAWVAGARLTAERWGHRFYAGVKW